MVNAHAASDGADVTIRSALGLELGDGAGVRVAWDVWNVWGARGVRVVWGGRVVWGVR